MSEAASLRPSSTSWRALAALLLSGALCAPCRAGSETVAVSGNIVGGWQVFTQKQCIRCHAIWNLGGQIGPDLGRIGQEYLTASDLAGTLWNHIPRMHSQMLQNGVPYPTLSLQEMSDLFSFLHFVRHLEEPGDAAAGQRIVREKGCVRCHTAEDRPAAPGGLDLRRWDSYANPILWAQKMWEHAPRMEQAMKDAGVTWPKLNDTDLVNIIAYVRSLGRHESKLYLSPGAADAGSRLFSERKCRSCHVRGGPAKDLATAELPRSLAALASRMWNHSPEMTRLMREQGVERSSLTPQDMADIIAYLLMLRYSERPGLPQRGREVFVSHNCNKCHYEEAKASSRAPAIETLATAFTPVRFAHSMWNHGVPMLEVMSELGSAPPALLPGEVADLIAYLKSAAGGSVGRPREEDAAAARQEGPAAHAPASTPPTGLPPPQSGASCASNACHSRLLAGRDVHAPVAQGECEACHRTVSPEKHEFQLRSSTSDLCYRCHEEPEATSRIYGPVSVTVCTTCHAPHSSENAYGPNFSGQELCFADMLGMTSALATLVGSDATLSSPAGAAALSRALPAAASPPAPPAASPAAREPPPAASFAGTASSTLTGRGPVKGTARVETARVEAVSVPPGAACASSDCHVAIVAGPELHPPVAQQQCEACHQPTDAQSHRFALKAKEPDLCYQCHDRTREVGSFVHGPVGQGLCTPCHNPHSAPYKPLLPAKGPELCFLCHSEMGSHLRKARVQHKAITEGERGCLSCHQPHRSNFKFQLTQDVPDLCYGCHKETQTVIATAVVSHAPVTTEKKCDNCHNPHGSDAEKILNDTEMNLCLGCHNQPMETPSGPLIDMKSWIENNPERHGPVREGLCTGCHLPHGSKNFRILRHNFPREFYRPFAVETYALCFECHESTIVLDRRTTTLTGFRNGDKNLHYVHVNHQKGRTCRACHEIHAGTQPKRMKDFVPFGDWKYPVNFTQTPDGGRCAPGCHVTRGYSRSQEIRQE